MKNNILTIKALVAVIAAVLFIPVGVGAACFAFTAAGFLAVFAADYGRSLEPVQVEAEIVPFRGQVRPAATDLAAA
jgi:hypothetical protein